MLKVLRDVKIRLECLSEVSLGMFQTEIKHYIFSHFKVKSILFRFEENLCLNAKFDSLRDRKLFGTFHRVFKKSLSSILLRNEYF